MINFRKFSANFLFIFTFYVLFNMSTYNVYAFSRYPLYSFIAMTFEKNFINNSSPILKKSEIISNNKVIVVPSETSVETEKALSEFNRKVAFLTFDDGPTRCITPKMLDILKNHNVKATFFVIGSLAERNPEIIKRTLKEGHSIGNHTYSHNYKKVYSSPKSFF
ncbi:polysaccharide deacetylase family protein [Haloimpatiens sp. FM7315]|uniref:polysaccharide deacetylase family protein n=1 Tax=Haloimpatiens sp. FM7315 TaxID=3298609 RepID=UPI0039775354